MPSTNVQVVEEDDIDPDNMTYEVHSIKSFYITFGYASIAFMCQLVFGSNNHYPFTRNYYILLPPYS